MRNRMSALALAGALASLAVSVPALAAATDKADQKPPKKERVICHTEPVVGSRLAVEKTCLTETQWRLLRHDQRQAMDRVQTFSHQD